MSLIRRFVNLFHRSKLDEDIDAELRSHIEMRTADNIAAGMSPKDARRDAHLRFGNRGAMKERVIAADAHMFFDTLWHDALYALRMLRKSPGFTAVAVLTLALGIGANTSLFSVVNGVLLNPLPYPNANQIVSLAQKTSNFPESSMSYPNFADWVHLNHSFAMLAAYVQGSFSLTGQGEPERITSMWVSATFFPLLGVNPVAGRNFSAQEDQLNGPPAVILSGGFWKTKFGSSPDIIGKELNLNGTDYTIVGVVPQDFYFCCGTIGFRLSDVYVPIGSSKNPWLHDRRVAPGIYAIGRMKRGMTLSQTRTDMDGVAQSLARAYPDADKDVGITVTPLKEEMVRDIRLFLFVQLAAAGFVLLIACVNVANLLLARSTGRAREFAIRAALGASQGRVVRQLLTESMILALAGGGLGLLLAAWGTNVGLSILPSTLPRANDVRIDPHVLLFTLAVSLLGGILFGLAPALKTSQPDLHETLKEGGRGGSGVRYRTQGIFVIVEMALAVVLLVGAGLTIRTLAALWRVNPGFDLHNIFSFNVGFPSSISNGTPEEIRASVQQLTQKIGGIPGISAISALYSTIPIDGAADIPFWVDGRPKPATESSMPVALFYMVDAAYLKVMKIRLLRGRFLTEQDTTNSPAVCVIDRDFARQFFGSQDPIGKRINLAAIYKQLEIVGVVDHVKQFGMDEGSNAPVEAQLYTSLLQIPDVQMKSFRAAVGYAVRTEGSPLALAGSIRDVIRDFNGNAVLYYPESMDQIISRSLAPRRFAMILLAAFAAVALLLSTIGIYGVVSYATGQRTHEIGIRMALGAQKADILRNVLGSGMRLSLLGVAVGLAASVGLTRLMAKILYGVSATDPLTFAIVATTLMLVALVACYIPARRAMRVDPMVALRYE